jgi:hypothetical protein
MCCSECVELSFEVVWRAVGGCKQFLQQQLKHFAGAVDDLTSDSCFMH